jgi:signal transduction histidine kinase
LYFCFEDPRVLNKEKRRMMRTLAHICAEALERAWLFDKASEAREQAEKAVQEREELIAIVAHELRAPMTPILGYSRSLLRLPILSDEQRLGLDVIRRNTLILSQLVEDLVDTSRITLKRIRLEFRKASLHDVIAEAIEVVQDTARAKGVALTCQVPDDMPPLMIDTKRIRQVLWNLLANSVKFTPAGGTVSVTASVDEDSVVCCVKDTGIGIPANLLPHVFDRFRQGDVTTATSSGLGLGLYIVRRLVELHGGLIAAHSPGENQGSTFLLKLPRHPKAARDVGLTGPRS